MDHIYFLGIALSLSSSTLTSLGLVLQKLALGQAQESGSSGFHKYSHPKWITGISLFGVGQVCNVLSAGMAPQVMLSSLGTWALISNAVFAEWFLGEKMQLVKILPIGGMVVGMLFVVAGTPPAGPSEMGHVTVEEYTTMWLARDTVGLTAVLLFCLLVSRIIIFRFLNKTNRNLPGLWWVILATMTSGYNMTLVKCGSELALRGTPQEYLNSPHFWVMVAVGLSFAVLVLHGINVSLGEGEALVVVPAYYASGMVFQIIVASVFFGELNGFTGMKQRLIFMGGVVSLLLCIAAIGVTDILCAPCQQAADEAGKYALADCDATPVLDEMVSHVDVKGSGVS